MLYLLYTVILIVEFNVTKMMMYPFFHSGISSGGNNHATKQSCKRVTFADHMGLELAKIRHMTAGIDTPPNLSPSIFAKLSLEPEYPKMVAEFDQPISDYISFAKRLEEHNVSLETCSSSDGELVGVIKVKNIGFEKNVFVRLSSDKWVTTRDAPAYYINSGLGGESSLLYDSFSFHYELPLVEELMVEFAICFRCNGNEYWDSNNGKNYKLTSERKEPTVGVPIINNNWGERRWAGTYLPYW